MTLTILYNISRPAKCSGHWLAGWFLLSLPALLLLFAAVNADAANSQSHGQLRDTARAFLETQLTDNSTQVDTEIQIGRLDSRLRLTPCTSAPKPFLSAGSRLHGKLTIGLRCEEPKPWTVYVPATIHRYADVIVAAHPLDRGARINEVDLNSVRRELSKLHTGYFTQRSEVIGKVLKRSISAGEILSPRRVKAPLVVRRGELVTIIAITGTLQVRGKGKALQDAARGESVPVRNTRSKRIIQAVAIKLGTVKVQM
jgi:flagella basal body P-ring formation protein FlgA